MNPTIGILFCGFYKDRQFVTDSYVKAISGSGGIPVVIPYSDECKSFTKYFQICDGFLFCGGDDITPLLFGENLITEKGRTDWKTDSFHLKFMEQALYLRFPVFGICRGMQVLNLALGGTIYQDISMRPETSLNHMQLSSDRSDICHRISATKSSILYKICGDTINVNSFHHQCIKTLGRNLNITAVAPDGVIEAIESSDFSFVIGVQWHPECMYLHNEPMKNLFLLFIESSKK